MPGIFPWWYMILILRQSKCLQQRSRCQSGHRRYRMRWSPIRSASPSNREKSRRRKQTDWGMSWPFGLPKESMLLSWLRTRIELMCIIISFLIPHPLMPPGSSKTSGCPALPCSVSVIWSVWKTDFPWLPQSPTKNAQSEPSIRAEWKTGMFCVKISIWFCRKSRSPSTHFYKSCSSWTMRSNTENTFQSEERIKCGSFACPLWRMDIPKQIFGRIFLASGNTSLQQNSALARTPAPSILSSISRASYSRKVSDISAGLLSTIWSRCQRPCCFSVITRSKAWSSWIRW